MAQNKDRVEGLPFPFQPQKPVFLLFMDGRRGRNREEGRETRREREQAKKKQRPQEPQVPMNTAWLSCAPSSLAT